MLHDFLRLNLQEASCLFSGGPSAWRLRCLPPKAWSGTCFVELLGYVWRLPSEYSPGSSPRVRVCRFAGETDLPGSLGLRSFPEATELEKTEEEEHPPATEEAEIEPFHSR